MEIVVGTALGMLYVVDGESGFVRHHFPLQFHSIQASIAVADITGGFELEMIVCDMVGTVALVSIHGDILWDRQVSGALPYSASVADINGDGQLDVIVVTVDTTVITDSSKSSSTVVRSHIYALHGTTGEVIDGFPIALPNMMTISGPIIPFYDGDALIHMLKTQRTHYQSNETEETLQYTKPFQHSSFSEILLGPKGHGGSLAEKLLAIRDYRNAQNNISIDYEKEIKDTPYDFVAGRSDVKQYRQQQQQQQQEKEKKQLQDTKTNNSTAQSESPLPPYETEEEKEEEIIDRNFHLPVYFMATSFEGQIYIIQYQKPTYISTNNHNHKKKSSHVNFCTQIIDINSPMTSTPLLTDITGDGYFDLVVTTLQGEVLVYETDLIASAASTIDSWPRHRGQRYSVGEFAIEIVSEERDQWRHSGLSLGHRDGIEIAFEIYDLRCPLGQDTMKITQKNPCADRVYSLSVYRGSSALTPIIHKKLLTTTGRHTIRLPGITGPEVTALMFKLSTEHGLIAEDHIVVNVNTMFYAWMKYFLLFPVLIVSALALTRIPLYIKKHHTSLASSLSTRSR
jgi:hypothetical protein